MRQTSEPKRLWTVEGPQTSLWIKVKGFEALVLLIGKDTHLCFASLQTSQWNIPKSNPLNKPGNTTLKILKEDDQDENDTITFYFYWKVKSQKAETTE